jgi:hypothetical protein
MLLRHPKFDNRPKYNGLRPIMRSKDEVEARLASNTRVQRAIAAAERCIRFDPDNSKSCRRPSSPPPTLSAAYTLALQGEFLDEVDVFIRRSKAVSSHLQPKVGIGPAGAAAGSQGVMLYPCCAEATDDTICSKSFAYTPWEASNAANYVYHPGFVQTREISNDGPGVPLSVPPSVPTLAQPIVTAPCWSCCGAACFECVWEKDGFVSSLNRGGSERNDATEKVPDLFMIAASVLHRERPETFAQMPTVIQDMVMARRLHSCHAFDRTSIATRAMELVAIQAQAQATQTARARRSGGCKTGGMDDTGTGSTGTGEQEQGQEQDVLPWQTRHAHVVQNAGGPPRGREASKQQHAGDSAAVGGS